MDRQASPEGTEEVSAQVVAYSSDPQDAVLSLRVECLDCGIEFGWGLDTPAANDRLEDLADMHNVEVHGYRKVVGSYAR